MGKNRKLFFSTGAVEGGQLSVIQSGGQQVVLF